MPTKHKNLLLFALQISLANSYINNGPNDNSIIGNNESNVDIANDSQLDDDLPAKVFDGVYTECILHFSYTCIQNRTLAYLNKINELKEYRLFGDYLKFVKVEGATKVNESIDNEEQSTDISERIDTAIDRFFDDHVLRFNPVGKDSWRNFSDDNDIIVEEFVGRKKRKGGGGGGDDGGGKGDHKKKMMMMAMMCMKMKMLMMVPAMMGMMSMMSLKGMMFSMMSFIIAKMMLLMKILEKKNGSGGGGGGDAWMSGGGGGGAWMPAGSSDGYGGPGGGYNAAGEWQNGRSILEQDMISRMSLDEEQFNKYKPQLSFVTPYVRINKDFSKNKKMKALNYKTIVDAHFGSNSQKSNKHDMSTSKAILEKDSVTDEPKLESLVEISTAYDMSNKSKSRNKRGVMDLISYITNLMSNRLFNLYRSNFGNTYPKYKQTNAMNYYYNPYNHYPQRPKYPKMIVPVANEIIVKDNGEDSRTYADEDDKKEADVSGQRTFDDNSLKKMSDVNEAMGDNPWQ